MISADIREILGATGGRLVRTDLLKESSCATSVAIDSRKIVPGSLFVAIKGEHADGHDFVRQAASTAVAAVVDHQVEADIAQIVVPDTVVALGRLARMNIEKRRALEKDFTVAAVTGSAGKTTTKDLLSEILRAKGSVVSPEGSFNNEIGLPLTALRVDENTRYFVAEAGASAVGELTYLASLVRPDIVIELKVGVAHLGVFGSSERLRAAKAELLHALPADGTAILNADDPNIANMDVECAAENIMKFGIENPDSLDCAAENIETDEFDRASFDLKFADGQRARISLNISGAHNVMNALSAASAAYSLGVDAKLIASKLSGMQKISPHRMAVFAMEKNGKKVTVIDDSFNANPDSVKCALQSLEKWDRGNAVFRTAVLSAMLELGESENELHEKIGEFASQICDAVILVGSRSDGDTDRLAKVMHKSAERTVERAVESSASQDSNRLARVIFAADIDEADKAVERLACENDNVTVLLKGSHDSGLDVLAERWEEQSR